MFKHLFSTFSLCLSLATLSTFSVSCDDDERPISPVPTPPTTKVMLPSELADVAHAEIVFVDGHLHDNYGFHANSYPQEMHYIGRRDTLRYSFEQGMWKADKRNPKKLPLMGSTSFPPTYAIVVNYFDQEGNPLNGNIASKDQQYQTFYYLTDIRPTEDGKQEEGDKNGKKFFEYTYCDTTPWDKTVKFDNAKLTGPTNPVGLKGFLRFNKARKYITLNVHLMKAKSSKFIGMKDGVSVAAPYYAPTTEQRAKEDWIPAIQLPIHLYMDRSDLDIDDLELTSKEADLDSDDVRTIHAMMRAFGITFEQAVSELYYNINGKRPPHNNHGGFWF